MGQSGGLDAEGNELPRLVYVSREKRPGFQHHKKAGAMNALVSTFYFLFLRSVLTSCLILSPSDDKFNFDAGSSICSPHEWTFLVES